MDDRRSVGQPAPVANERDPDVPAPAVPAQPQPQPHRNKSQQAPPVKKRRPVGVKAAGQRAKKGSGPVKVSATGSAMAKGRSPVGSKVGSKPTSAADGRSVGRKSAANKPSGSKAAKEKDARAVGKPTGKKKDADPAAKKKKPPSKKGGAAKKAGKGGDGKSLKRKGVEKGAEAAISSVASPAVGKAVTKIGGKLADTKAGKAAGKAMKWWAAASLVTMTAIPVVIVFLVVSALTGASRAQPAAAATAALGDGVSADVVVAYNEAATDAGIPWETVTAVGYVQTDFGKDAKDGVTRDEDHLFPSVAPAINTQQTTTTTTTTTAPPTTEAPTTTVPPAAAGETTTVPPATTAAPVTTVAPAGPPPPATPPADYDPDTRLGPFLISDKAGISVEDANNQQESSKFISGLLADYIIAHDYNSNNTIASQKEIWVGAFDSLPVRGAKLSAAGSPWANRVFDVAAAWEAGNSAKCSSAVSLSAADLPPGAAAFIGMPLGGNKGNLGILQYLNAMQIVTTGVSLQVPRRGLIIAIATSITEIGLINDPSQADHDSAGLFQQRPSQGWGTLEQVTDPGHASTKFFQHLLAIPGWETMAPGDAAQKVQVSGYPDRYAIYIPAATSIVDSLTGGTTTDTPSGTPTAAAVTPVTATPATGDTPASVATGKVLVVGDSLTVGAQSQGFPTTPAGVDVHAVTGLHVSEGVDYLKTVDLGSYSKIIIALGSNDAAMTATAMTAQIDAAMAVVGNTTPVTWVNVDAGKADLTAASTGIDPAIAAAPAKHPNLTMGDWNGYVAAQPNAEALHGGDPVHYDAAGYKLRADWMNNLTTSGGTAIPAGNCTSTTGLGTVGNGTCEPAVLSYALDNAPDDAAKKTIQAACTQIGKPYVWGGGHYDGFTKVADPPNFDCSSFTAWSWARGGVNFGGTTYTQVKLGTEVPSLAEAKPGDLIFLYGLGHVAIYMGNNKIIHAPNSSKPVLVSTLSGGIDNIRRVG